MILLLQLLLLTQSSNAQIGTPFVNDICHDLLFSQDGSFISCGAKGANGSIYKTSCSGAIIAQIEKSFSPISTTFWGAVELADGSIVAVGSAFVANAIDTVEEVVLLKTDATLTETASAHFRINANAARAKAITLSKSGHLLLIGEVQGVSIDVTDMFFQRASPVTLQPTATPVIYNNGVDLAAKIIPLADDFYLISGSNFFGNILNPLAPVANRLIAIKVNDTGNIQWNYQYEKIFLAALGVSQSGGAAQNSASGNIILSGNTGSDSTGLDPIFLVLNNNGLALDTITTAIPERQSLFNTIAHSSLPGFFTAVGESENPFSGASNLFAYQAYELNNSIVGINPILDPSQNLSIPDLVEYQTDRFTFALAFPDNQVVLGSKDYFILTPALLVKALYENCVLYATDPDEGPALSPGLDYSWYQSGSPNAIGSGEQFLPSESGDYYVVVSDAAGCSAISDTVHVDFLSAGFTYTSNNLSFSFTNTSQEADTYLWNFGDALTSIQVNPIHIYSIPGIYTVTLTATNDCGSKTYTQIITITSPTKEPSWLSSFQLAPNPGNGQFTVDMSGLAQETLAFTLYGSTGQNLYSEQVDFQTGALKKAFDFGNLPAAMYLLQIRGQGEVKYVRVVVKG